MVSSPAEWDHFESQFWATAEAQLAEDPSDPERQRTAAHWANWKRAYKEWGRDTLGFVFLLLQKP